MLRAVIAAALCLMAWTAHASTITETHIVGDPGNPIIDVPNRAWAHSVSMDRSLYTITDVEVKVYLADWEGGGVAASTGVSEALYTGSPYPITGDWLYTSTPHTTLAEFLQQNGSAWFSVGTYNPLNTFDFLYSVMTVTATDYAVPEPASGGLLVVAMSAMMLLRRRRR